MRPFDIVRATDAESTGSPAQTGTLELESSDPSAPFGPYLLSPEVATAVNVALALDQPLLVTGEPGTGKTSLAWAVAAQLGSEVFEFHTKSTSVARDLLYTVDTLRRFHDASVGVSDATDASRYIEYQALGRAIQSSKTRVVLIDEIDKAPRDFPNDILNELDRMEFTVSDTFPPQHFRQTVRHFVLITSNSERRLPLPFLRRCAYVHLPFPSPDLLSRIVTLHLAGLRISDSFGALAVKRFLELREAGGLEKPPATGELLAWVRVLARMGVDEATLRGAALDGLPGLEALIKLVSDRQALRDAPRM